jgi:subtilisin family serine protease
MKKSAIIILASTLFLAAPVLASEPNSVRKIRIHKNQAYAQGELLVKYKRSVRVDAADHYRNRWKMVTLRRFKDIEVQHMRLPKEMKVEEALEICMDDPDVEYAEPNFYRYVAAIPNDTDFNLLWGLENTGQIVNGSNGNPDGDIDAPEAWDITTGSSDVVVAVIDSGVDYRHPDLSANMWTNTDEIADNGIDDDLNGYVDDVKGWDFNDEDNDPNDADGHGTHVSGTIAAVGNNAVGVTGVSWTSKIMALKFTNTFGLGTTSDAIRAIEYANEKGAEIINCGWGGPDFSKALEDAVDASSAVVVCAAGNDGSDNDNTPFYPASFTSTNIIAVAATDQDDDLAAFSNFGAKSVDVAAPGTNIYSSEPGRQMIWRDNFDDGDITDWQTGGANNTWGTSDSVSFSGSNSVTDSPGDDYENNTDSWIISPAIDLTFQSSTRIEFRLRGSSEQNLDFLYLEASTDQLTWVPLNLEDPVFAIANGISGNFLTWLRVVVDFGKYDGHGSVYFRFRFLSNGSKTDDGWYIDNVVVTAAASSYDGTEYGFKQGTSMATAFVSGLAALTKSQARSLNNLEIKRAIETSVDIKASLNEKVVSRGRVNASQALEKANIASVDEGDGGGCFLAIISFDWQKNVETQVKVP